ncbi:MAG: efflux RND transporter periplasmic adaptor subunit [Terriglobia bacterium]
MIRTEQAPSIMSLGDAPKYGKKRTQPSPRGEGGERSEPGEGSRLHLSEQSLASLETLRFLRGIPKQSRRPRKARGLRCPARRGFLGAGLLAGILACSLLPWSACSSKETAAPEPVVLVQVATVEPKTIQRVITAEALLYPLRQADIVPKISAPVERYFVERGSQVHSGELLAELENHDLAAAVVQSKGVYQQAQAAYVTATGINLPAQIQTAELTLTATKQTLQAEQRAYQSDVKLYRSGALARKLFDLSRVAYVQARNQYEIAEAHLRALQAVGKAQQLKAAAAALSIARGQYLAAKAQYDYSEIRSPITGVVTSRPLFEGEMASAGTPLMTVMNISHVVARVHVSPEQAAELRVGDPASISLGHSHADAPGKISVVSPALDPNSTTVQVWVDAPNPGHRLKAGATVQVNMVAQTIKNALVVPAAALLTASDGTTSVMVVGPHHHAHQINVKAGIREGNEVQIVSGLKAGELVVSEGAYGLPDGAKVKF